MLSILTYMGRVLLFIAAMLCSRDLLAQTNSTCIDLTQSWTRQFPAGTIPYVTYQVPNLLLIIMTVTRQLTKYNHVLVNVPQLVANQLNALTAADAYIAQILPQYHEALLNENGCPILYEKSGFFPIWTR